MASSFSAILRYDGRQLLAVIVPALRSDGMAYEVNIAGFPRFVLRWGASDRYEVRSRDVAVPDGLVLAVSDVIEARN